MLLNRIKLKISIYPAPLSGRSHEATVKINSVPTAAAGTYKFSFALETGETYSANLVVNVIEKSRSLKDGTFNKLAPEKYS